MPPYTMGAMHDDIEQRIKEERARVTALDSTLDAERTPYLKGRLQRAADILDDAVDALHFADIAEPNYVTMWTGFAETNMEIAAQLRQKVKAAVDKFGGPDHIIEMGR